MKKWRLFLSLVLMLVGLAWPSTSEARGCWPPFNPHGYTKPTPDGLHIFVMKLPPERAPIEQASNPVLKYPASGLYSKNDTTNPLWKVDWYIIENAVTLSPDGVYTVEYGGHIPSTSKNEDDTPALTFYRNGQEIKYYSLVDLGIDKGKLTEEKPHYCSWMHPPTINTSGKLEVEVQTVGKFVFDFDGTIIEQPVIVRPIKWNLIILAVLAVFGLAILVRWGWQRRKNKLKAQV